MMSNFSKSAGIGKNQALGVGLALGLGLALALAGASLVPGLQSPALAQTKRQPAQPAQPAAPPAPTGIKVVLKTAPDQPDWLKVCQTDPATKKTVCFTTRDFVAENNQPVMAVAVFEIKDDNRRFVRFLVPLTFLIQPGIRYSIEGLSPLNARFQICVQQGCFVEGDLNDAAIGALKKGQLLKIDMQNQVGQEVNFEAPIAGFAKAFDGPGIDQAQLQKIQEQQQQQLQQQNNAAPAGQGEAPSNAEDLKKKGEELLKQRQQAPKP